MNLPKLKILELGNGFMKEITYIPQSLEYLILSKNYNQDLNALFLTNYDGNLKYVEVGSSYSHIFDHTILPKGINVKVDKEKYKELLMEREMSRISFV